MFKFFLLFLSCIAASPALAANPLKATPLNKHWTISDSEEFYLYATEPETQTIIVIFTDSLAPAAGGCEYREKRKDIPFETAVYKQKQPDDKRADKIAGLDKLRLSIKTEGHSSFLLKPAISEQLNSRDKWVRSKNIIRLGKLNFVSPVGCTMLENAEFSFSGLQINSQKLPDLTFKLKYRDRFSGGLRQAPQK